MELEYTKIRVVDFDLKELVVLPREIDLNEWLASNSELLWWWSLIEYIEDTWRWGSYRSTYN